MKRIIFFDGICNLCNRTVDFIIKLDTKRIFYFAPLQGRTAKEHGLEFSKERESVQSLVYIDADKKSYKRSTAVIHILRDLFPLGSFFLVFKIIPTHLRDTLYSFIARERYRLFGKRKTCRLPSKEEEELFLD